MRRRSPLDAPQLGVLHSRSPQRGAPGSGDEAQISSPFRNEETRHSSKASPKTEPLGLGEVENGTSTSRRERQRESLSQGLKPSSKPRNPLLVPLAIDVCFPKSRFLKHHYNSKWDLCGLVNEEGR